MYLYSMLYSMVLSTDTNFNVAVVSRAYIAGDALPPRPESHAAATATRETHARRRVRVRVAQADGDARGSARHTNDVRHICGVYVCRY